MKRLALVVVLALTGCGTVRALAGPDPALAAAAPDIRQALANDATLHPENKNKDADADAALANAVDSKRGPAAADALTGLGQLFGTAPGLAAVGGLLTAAGGLWHTLANRKKLDVVAGTVDQHAGLIDSVTPDTAADAAKTKSA
jgi:hypothetical protein